MILGIWDFSPEIPKDPLQPDGKQKLEYDKVMGCAHDRSFL
jgi:hypothetical protein